jgi:DUF4097 and DUF4098 domain-containing protein YvlB
MKLSHLISPYRSAFGLVTVWALLVVAMAAPAATTESNISKVFPVKPGGKLVLSADRGSVKINTSDRSDVSVEVKRKVKGASSAKAAEIFESHKVTFSQDGDEVTVRGKCDKDIGGWFHFGKADLEVEFIVGIPKKFNLDLNTALGSIAVQDIEGAVKAKSSCGSLRFAVVLGTLDARTSLGQVDAERVTGAATLKSANGSLRLDRAEAESELETALGSIHLKSAAGKLKARSSSGSLEFGELTAPADVETQMGSIKVGLAHDRLRAHSSSGSIHIKDAKNTVVADTSMGSIEAGISSQPADDCELRTSSGSIHVRLDKELGFDLDARTSAGRVSSELPVTTTVVGTHAGGSLTGKLNGGGKKLSLRTNMGSVTIGKL